MTVGPNCIETMSGIFIDLLDPKTEQIVLEDIAWALSRVPRYVGHTVSLLPYTVGQHSIAALRLVRRLKDPAEVKLREHFLRESALPGDLQPDAIDRVVQMHVLLHDGSEAYLMDLPTPLKRLPGMAQAYGEYERQMMLTIWQRFNMPEPDEFTQAVIAWADRYVLTVEAFNLIRSRGVDWPRLFMLEMDELLSFEPPQPTWEVYQEFCREMMELW